MHNFIPFKTIISKEVNRFMRIWTQTLLPPVINQILYFLVFGTFIGRAVGEIQGLSYIEFIIPGLVAMTVLNGSFMNVVSSFFGAKFQKQIEELLVSPITTNTIILGFTLASMLRGVLVGILVYLTSQFFVPTSIVNPGYLMVIVFLSAFVFAQAGLSNAIFAKKFDDINIFPTFVLRPLVYFGGVFYSVASLPEKWQLVTKINPIFYMVDGFRFGFFGVSELSANYALYILALFAAGFYAFNYYLISNGIRLKN
jgi:ABC-2 type transport system permease protein